MDEIEKQLVKELRKRGAQRIGQIILNAMFHRHRPAIEALLKDCNEKHTNCECWIDRQKALIENRLYNISDEALVHAVKQFNERDTNAKEREDV